MHQLPEWAIVILGAVLPFVYQSFLSKLPAWLKFVITWGTSGTIALAAMLLIWHIAPADLLRNVALLWATMQIVYQLFVKKSKPATFDTTK